MANDRQVVLQWRTVSYRTVLVAAAVIIVVLGVLAYAGFFPGLSRALHRVLDGGSRQAAAPPVAAAPQARFINVEGGVLVKRAGSVDFTPAQPSTVLHQGDTVQTQSNGWARIQFGDSTNYVLSPNSLIVVEQSQFTAHRSSLAVQVSSGRVDLSTGQFDGPGSSSRVRFANAAAALKQNTRAEVVSQNNAGTLTVVAGAARVRRGQQTVRVGAFQRLNVQPGRAMALSTVAQPPQLVAPGNLEPLVSAHPAQVRVHFQWTAAPGAVRYEFQLSRSPLMSNLLLQRQLTGTTTVVSGLAAGNYYWDVASIGSHGAVTPPLDANKFSLIASRADGKLPLRLTQVTEIAPGVLEVDGKTAPGAKVLVNDEVVGLIQSDGSFQYITPNLPRQPNFVLTVTAEDNQGRVATRTRLVNIQ
jgi:hypothetical protein